MRKLYVSGCEQFASAGEAGSKPRMRTVVSDHQSTVSYADCVLIDVCLPNLCLCRPTSIFLAEFCLSMFSMLNYQRDAPFPKVRAQQHGKNSPESPLSHVAIHSCISEYVYGPKTPCKNTGFALCFST